MNGRDSSIHVDKGTSAGVHVGAAPTSSVSPRICDVLRTPEFGTSPIYQRLQGVLDDLLTARTFKPDEIHKLQYIPSRSPEDRYGASQVYEIDEAVEDGRAAAFNSAELGPSERSLLHYLFTRKRMLVTFVGDMGSGKSTTLNYIINRFLSEPAFLVLRADFNTYQTSTTNTDSEIERDLLTYLARLFQSISVRLVKPSEEFKEAWDWALAQDWNHHPTRLALNSAIDQLRAKLGDEWQSSSEEALKVRAELRPSLEKDVIDYLKYQLFLIDYYVTVKCGGDERKLVVVFDDVDPLPDRYQRILFERALRIANIAPFKFIIAMRPMTFEQRMLSQGAYTVYKPIIHRGPSFDQILRARLAVFLGPSDDDVVGALAPLLLPFKIRTPTDDFSIGPAEIRRWCTRILDSLTVRSADVPRFIEGIAGDSLRMAILLSAKAFRSNIIPFHEFTHTPNRSIKAHELVRSLMTRDGRCYVPDGKRIVDNIFCVGERVPNRRGTLLCKTRMCSFLRGRGETGADIGELRAFMRLFEISGDIILAALNSALLSQRRLIASDTFSGVLHLDNCDKVRVRLTKTGAYYIGHVIRSLEYVQEAHYSCELPAQMVISHDPRNFVDRTKSLGMFIRQLCEEDRHETMAFIAETPTRRYTEIFGPSLVSIEIMRALGPQIRKVGAAIARLREGAQRRSAEVIDDALTEWEAMSTMIGYQSTALIEHLARAAAQ